MVNKEFGGNSCISSVAELDEIAVFHRKGTKGNRIFNDTPSIFKPLPQELEKKAFQKIIQKETKYYKNYLGL